MIDELEIFKGKLSLSDIKTEMAKHKPADCPLTHHFADGQYAREVFIPAGTIALGKKHRASTINVLLAGKLLIYNGENSDMIEMEAPAVYTTEAGVQKLAYVIEDVRWLNVIPTDETDVNLIENNVTFPEGLKCLS